MSFQPYFICFVYQILGKAILNIFECYKIRGFVWARDNSIQLKEFLQFNQSKCVISREGVVTMRHSPIDPFCSTVRPDLHCHDSYIRINNLCTKVSYAILIYYIVTCLIILLFYLNLSF